MSSGPMEWQGRELVTQLFLGGKSKTELDFPASWTYDILLRVWEKDGYDATVNGEPYRAKWCLSDKLLAEMGW